MFFGLEKGGIGISFVLAIVFVNLVLRHGAEKGRKELSTSLFACQIEKKKDAAKVREPNTA